MSLHHVQHIDESKNSADRTYDFYPERKVYVRNGVENPSVAEPLDEGSFVYFMRSVPLEVGKTYEFNRYYHVDRNPVVIQVVRKERIKVPAGEFDAIVVKPIIKSKGLVLGEWPSRGVVLRRQLAYAASAEVQAVVWDVVFGTEVGEALSGLPDFARDDRSFTAGRPSLPYFLPSHTVISTFSGEYSLMMNAHSIPLNGPFDGGVTVSL